MSGLIKMEEGGHPEQGARPSLLTTERWVAIYVLAALGSLYLARRAFSEFIPK